MRERTAELERPTSSRGCRMVGILAGVGALVVADVTPAATQEAPRQTLEFSFDAAEPSASTGLRLGIEYHNPADPAAKPPAVQTVVETLAPGASIDTSVPARCTASDAELVTVGSAACPADSVVGGGAVDLDTGIPGPSRTVHATVVQFNNTDELILLFEPDSGSGLLRSVSRAPITEGGTVITAQAPPLPGGPPDGYTALKRVQLELQPRVALRDGVPHAYITTPPTCPPSRTWTNTVTFTYRDQVTQTATSTTACHPGRTGGAPATDPGPPSGASANRPDRGAGGHGHQLPATGAAGPAMAATAAVALVTGLAAAHTVTRARRR